MRDVVMSVLMLLLGFAVGAGTFLFLRSELPVDRPVSERPADHELRRVPLRGLLSDGPTETPVTRPSPAEPPRPSCEDRIRGRVYTSTGTGLPNAVVRALGAGAASETMTDMSGEYTLFFPDGAVVDLTAEADGYVLEPPMGHVADRVAGGGRVDFLARRVIELPIEVYMPDGAPVGHAAIEIHSSVAYSDNESIRKTLDWSPSTPTIELTSGSHVIRARGGQGLASTTRHVRLYEAYTNQPLRLKLEETCAIRGFVLTEEENRNEDFSVKVMRIGPDTDLTMFLGEQRRTGAPGTTPFHTRHLPPSNRSFVFHDLGAGNYAVLLLRQREVVLAKPVAVVPGFVDIELFAPPSEPEDVLIFHVRDENGAPVSRATFMFRYMFDSGASGTSGSAALPHLEATYIVHPRPAIRAFLNGDTPGSCHVNVSHSDVGSKRVELSPGGPREFDVTLDWSEMAMVDLTLDGWRATDIVRDLGVSLESVDGSRFGSVCGSRFDSTGRASLRCRPGTYDLKFELDIPEGSQPITVHHEVVELEAGETHEHFTVPPLFPLTVHLGDSNERRLSIYRLDVPAYLTTLSDADAVDGRVTFGGLPAGHYRLTLGGRTVDVSLDGAKELWFPSDE